MDSCSKNMDLHIETDAFFESAFKEATKTHDTLGDKIVSKAEAEFKGFSEEERSRQDEISQIKEEVNKLRGNLRKCTNIKNPKMQEANKKRSDKRKELKKEIALLEIRLQEIEDERKGSSLSTKDMVSGMGN